jgi:hypothetical protein
MENKYHTTLANYFASQPLYLDIVAPKKANIRKLKEQPWQLIKANAWFELNLCLFDIEFIKAKTAAKLRNDLVKAYISV